MMKLSIITINLNNLTGLRKTIQSVVNQSFKDYEYIIIDGGSTDGSVDVIRQFEDKIAYWVSEPDMGIYNAMNKGIQKASSEYCMFLNSGDILSDSHILDNCFSNRFKEDIIYGNIIFDDKGILKVYKLPSELSFYHFFDNSIAHPCTFIKRELFNKIGLYNENFKIVSDWEFFLKAIFLHKCSLLYLNIEIVLFNCEGITSYSRDICVHERSLVLNELFPRFLNDYTRLFEYDAETHIHSKNKYIQLLVRFLNYLINLKKVLYCKLKSS